MRCWGRDGEGVWFGGAVNCVVCVGDVIVWYGCCVWRLAEANLANKEGTVRLQGRMVGMANV